MLDAFGSSHVKSFFSWYVFVYASGMSQRRLKSYHMTCCSNVNCGLMNNFLLQLYLRKKFEHGKFEMQMKLDLESSIINKCLGRWEGKLFVQTKEMQLRERQNVHSHRKRSITLTKNEHTLVQNKLVEFNINISDFKVFLSNKMHRYRYSISSNLFYILTRFSLISMLLLISLVLSLSCKFSVRETENFIPQALCRGLRKKMVGYLTTTKARPTNRKS